MQKWRLNSQIPDRTCRKLRVEGNYSKCWSFLGGISKPAHFEPDNKICLLLFFVEGDKDSFFGLISECKSSLTKWARQSSTLAMTLLAYPSPMGKRSSVFIGVFIGTCLLLLLTCLLTFYFENFLFFCCRKAHFPELKSRIFWKQKSEIMIFFGFLYRQRWRSKMSIYAADHV